jgi:hypothetical protein
MGRDGKPRFKVYCPVSVAERNKRLTAREKWRVRSSVSDMETDDDNVKISIRSALELQFDWCLHQMTGYMRCLDGADQTGVPRSESACRPSSVPGLFRVRVRARQSSQRPQVVPWRIHLN